jgi:hypothetical protein
LCYYYWQKRVWDKEIMDLSPETKTKLLESRSIQFAQVNLSPVLLSTVLEAVVRGV